MGLFIDDLCPSVIVTHVLYKAALVIALLRWALSWAIKLRNHLSAQQLMTINDDDDARAHGSPRCASAQLIRDGLGVTSFGELSERLVPGGPCEACAVCLNRFGARDEVRELRNCCHVFHRECLDTWLDHDRQNRTCPLCRSPFLTESQRCGLSSAAARSSSQQQQPSWAVERLLYLFGDDLLM